MTLRMQELPGIDNPHIFYGHQPAGASGRPGADFVLLACGPGLLTVYCQRQGGEAVGSERYQELYEAVYFLDRIRKTLPALPRQITRGEGQKLGLTSSVYTATLRILAASQMLALEQGRCYLTPAHREKHRHILEQIIPARAEHYAAMYDSAQNPDQFLFTNLSNLEYEVYSRCNYDTTFPTGSALRAHCDLSHQTVLEPGGNSGGLAAALSANRPDCHYTIVDREIPCRVGRQLNAEYPHINYQVGDVFALDLPPARYDRILLANLLHDFGDEKCLQILANCRAYSGPNTKLWILEDVLTGEFAPQNVVLHGLRLAVYCRGGRQRTLEEFSILLESARCRLETALRLGVYTLLEVSLCQ